MSRNTPISRRHFAALLAASPLAMAQQARANTYREITWDELVPRGVPFSEIIGEGYMDEENDIWLPIFDEFAYEFNEELENQNITIPGYIIPLEFNDEGVTDFILVPYVGACIHVPPPPPNQLIFVTTTTPWQSYDMWDAVWVSGRLRANIQSTAIAEIGYEIAAERIEFYEW